MNLRLFYYLIFYKLYRFTSITNSSKGVAILSSSLMIGFLLVFWILDLLAAFEIYYDILPSKLILPIFGMSVGLNFLYIMRKKKYESIIAEIESTKISFVFHGLAYLLFVWTFVGIIFL